MAESWLVIFALTGATFATRLGGILLGLHIPRHGAWARGLNALPGCLIVSLVSLSILSGGTREWIAGGAAGGAAILTRNLPVTMAVGIVVIWMLRHFT
jgi:uncharacterized membrane protein